MKQMLEKMKRNEDLLEYLLRRNVPKAAHTNVKLKESVVCKGVTKSGLKCYNRTLEVSGYCHLH
jgi:hypothetical protein